MIESYVRGVQIKTNPVIEIIHNDISHILQSVNHTRVSKSIINRH